MPRINGWHKPFDTLQIIAWVLFPVLIGGFYAFSLPFLKTPVAISCGILYGLMALFLLFVTIACTSTNPIDNNILASESPISSISTNDEEIYCNVCRHFVNKNSRHCRVCDKCVSNFDHHCKWLNNCIGKKNYGYFIGSILSAFSLTSIHLGIAIYLLVLGFSNEEEANIRVVNAYGCKSVEISTTCPDKDYWFHINLMIGFQIVYIALVAPSCYLTLQLILFHFQLYRNNQTTYEYIVRERKREIEKQRQREIDQTNGREWYNFYRFFFTKRKENDASNFSSPEEIHGYNATDKQKKKVTRGFGIRFNNNTSNPVDNNNNEDPFAMKNLQTPKEGTSYANALTPKSGSNHA